MNAVDRRQLAIAAINAVNGGVLAGDTETDIVDFKEEKGTIDGSSRQRVPISSRDEKAAAALAAEAACMSNSRDGGVLVVGVDDKASGPEAFVDTYLDPEWLRQRIYDLTVPHLSVDEIEEYPVHGKRVYLVNVHAGLEEVRVDGVLRGRRNKRCVDLTGDAAREFLEERRNFDWSAEDSGLRLSDADPKAIAEALRLYEETRGHHVPNAVELVRRLQLNWNDEPDPVLTRAAALLFCPGNPTLPLVTVLVTTIEGARSTTHEECAGPLVLAFQNAWGTIDAAFKESSIIVNALRRSIQAVPKPALREALVNALMHRDFRHDRSAVVALATGTPTETLKVTSPGGFVSGVDGTRLLTAAKRRNPLLAAAMRNLGIGEGEGVGVDTMYVAMLRDGHAAPEIVESGGDVICRLTGGEVDVAIRTFFDDLYRKRPGMAESAGGHIAIIELLHRPTLRAEWLTGAAQCTVGEANQILDRLLDAGAIERLLDRSRSFRLTRSAREALQSRISYTTRLPFDENWEVLRALFDGMGGISSLDARVALDVTTTAAATQVLRQAKKLGLITTQDGRERGRGVRYVITDKGRFYRP